jgi:hypothetical protein
MLLLVFSDSDNENDVKKLTFFSKVKNTSINFIKTSSKNYLNQNLKHNLLPFLINNT